MISAEQFHTKHQADAVLKGLSLLTQALTKAFPMLAHDLQHVLQEVDQDLQNAGQSYETAILNGQGSATLEALRKDEDVVLPRALGEGEGGSEVIWRGAAALAKNMDFTDLGGAAFDLLLRDEDVNAIYERARELDDEALKVTGTYIHKLEDERFMRLFILRSVYNNLPILLTFRAVDGVETLTATGEIYIPSEKRWVRDVGLNHIPAKYVEQRVEDALRSKGWKKPAAEQIRLSAEQVFNRASGATVELSEGEAVVLAETLSEETGIGMEMNVRSALTHEQEGARYSNLVLRIGEATVNYYFRSANDEFELIETEGLERPLPAEVVRQVAELLAAVDVIAPVADGSIEA